MTEALIDIAIIGAGSAGLSALRVVRKSTQSFVLIDAGPYGTTCARVGCMPSKTLIEAANAFHGRHAFEAFGIRGADALVADIPAVLRRVRALRDDFVAGALKATADLGERSITGHARLVAPDLIAVGGRELRARNIIVTTGSTPVVPRAWARFGERVLTTDSLFEQTDLPARIAVVGMGALGVEIAQALARLGIEVTGFGKGDRVAGLDDPVVNTALLAALRSEFDVHLGAAAEVEADAGALRVRSGTNSVQVDAVVAALGRRPNVHDIGLEALGVELDEHGLPPVEPSTLQVAGLPVYLAGDANAHRPLLHEAADEGHIAALLALDDDLEAFRRRVPISIVFCQPNVAVIGQRFGELDAHRIVVGQVDYGRQSRARAAQLNRGIIRIYADKRDGRLLGAQLCAPAGEHMAHLLALALERSLSVHDMLRMPFYHPVLEEGLRSALRELSAQLPACGASDLAACENLGVEALN